MRIVRDFPPIWDEINAAFQVEGKPVIFAWGETVYNPAAIEITAPLLAHEMMHGRQQGDDISGWWRRYIDDSEFRLSQEIPAHQAEYLASMKVAANRHVRRTFEKLIAKRLASPLYGNLITAGKARQILKEAA